MRRINLLPPELAARRRSRQLLGMIVGASVALLVVLGIVFAAQQARLSGERKKLEDQQNANAQLRRQVAALESFASRQQDLRNKEQLLTALTRNEVLWSGILTEISLVIPPDDWLTSLTGSLSVSAATGAIGQIQVAGCTLIPPDGDHLNVAQFLIQIAKPLSFGDDPFLTLTSKSDAEDCPVQFNAQIQLTEQARRSAQPGRERRI